MAFPVYRSGFTGPSAKIGGSTDYHIDLKLLEALPVAERVKAVDSLAKQYQSIGRNIEFSNASVSGRKWDPSLDLSDKVQLLNQAASAHSHSRHPGWQSLDFYVPLAGKSRFDKGAVEDASIFIPGMPGGKIRRGSGGGYGYFSESLDPSGKVVFRVGHGNVDRPESEALIDVGELSAGPADQSQQASSTQKGAGDFLQDYLKQQMMSQLAGQLLQNQKRKDPMEQFKQMMGSMPLGIMKDPYS